MFNLNGSYIQTLEYGISDYCYDEKNNRIIMSLEDEDLQFAYLNLDGLILESLKIRLKNKTNGRAMLRILVYILLGVFCSCARQRDRHVEYALNQAGKNRGELEKVLLHYAGDSLKLEAAKFLIRNMVYHTGFYDTLLNPFGQACMPEILYTPYPDERMAQIYDSLFRCGYHVRSVKKRDAEVVTADFLVENIDCAFAAWQKPWAKYLSFDDFCRYVLPYRSSSEPLSTLRREIQRRYFHVLDSAGVTNPIDACMLLNERMKGVFYFVGILPLYSSVESVDKMKWSNCEGIAMYSTFLMRSVGIPVVLDGTTWSKRSDGHSWCAVMDEERKWHGFGVAELNCEQHKDLFSKKRFLIPPKVYRRVFMPEPVEYGVPDDGYRTYVKNPLYKDVTVEYYVPPIDIEVELPKEPEGEKASFIYLCASAVNDFRVLAVGVREGRKCIVKDVVGDNTFLLAESPDGANLRFLTDTFYVDSVGCIAKPIKFTK